MIERKFNFSSIINQGSFFFSEKALLISEEFTVYAGQNLTLLCHPRDSSLDSVDWYRVDKDKKKETLVFHSRGPSFTITMATVDDLGIYWCVAAEWGTWGIRRYFMVNVIGELTEKSSLARTERNCVNIEGEGREWA